LIPAVCTGSSRKCINTDFCIQLLQLYEFKKFPVPEDATEKKNLSDRLMAIGVSLRDYRKSFEYAILILIH